MDIKKNPASIIKATLKFIEHRIHLIDLKGIHEYLKKGSHHQMTRNDYADLLLMTSNTVKLVLEGAISHKSSPI